MFMGFGALAQPLFGELQKRLSELLQNCIAEINQERKVYTTLSHKKEDPLVESS